MRTVTAFVIGALLVPGATLDAQRRRQPARPARAAPVKTEPAKVKCPESLGTGVKSGAEYCFVLAGREPADGVLISIPPHTGEATVQFELHNRHTFSEELLKSGRGYASYTAVIGILSLKGDLLDRAAVQTEFRAAGDLHERISGGAGPGGVKAVAPIGAERVRIAVPPGVDQISLLGETLDATTAAGRERASPGRPVAIVSNVVVEYRPRR